MPTPLYTVYSKLLLNSFDKCLYDMTPHVRSYILVFNILILVDVIGCVDTGFE